MAVLPLRWPKGWEKHYAKLAVCFAALTIGDYVFVLPPAALKTVAHTAQDYAGFITLIGSLYIVSGGIHLDPGGVGAAGGSTLFLARGGLASNLLGPTGASMLLIRPWLRMNRSRQRAPSHGQIHRGSSKIQSPSLLAYLFKWGVPVMLPLLILL
jgi:Na+/H+ antiporter NhaD/arsenite permease-like protein